MYVFTYQIQVSSIILTIFRRGNFTPLPRLPTKAVHYLKEYFKNMLSQSAPSTI